jgi:hypothetical protein
MSNGRFVSRFGCDVQQICGSSSRYNRGINAAHDLETEEALAMIGMVVEVDAENRTR